MNTTSFTRLDHGKDLPAPEYATPGAAGMDLMAAVPADEVGARLAGIPTRYYTASRHAALFDLPPFVRDALGPD